MSVLNGPGKYDAEATLVREQSGAPCVAVIVIGGNRGSGFSVQGQMPFIKALPELLENMASAIRAQQHKYAG